MKIEYDPARNALNIKKYGISFTAARDMDWDDAYVLLDTRFLYGEARMAAVIPMGERLFFVAFVDHEEDCRQVISIRPATRKEVRDYVGNR